MAKELEEVEKGFYDVVNTVGEIGMDVVAMAESMLAMDEDKNPIELDETDKVELATLLLCKGGMTTIKKKSDAFEDKTKSVGVPWMLARSVKTVTVPGIGTFSLVNGSNKSISADPLRKSMLKHGVPAAKINVIIEESTKTTSYTTLQFKPATPKKGNGDTEE